MTTHITPSKDVYRRYLPWRRTFEVIFWIALTLFNGVANSITVLMDIRRSGLDFADWEPAV